MRPYLAALHEIVEPDEQAAVACQHLLDSKTKPRGSLGRLEELACWLAAVQRAAPPRLEDKVVVVMAGDHGVAEEGVSAYPAEVTGQMVANFARGGAAVNVLTRQVGARVVVVDVGVRFPVEGLEGVRVRRVRAGTRNFTRGPALEREEVEAALDVGVELGWELAEAGVRLVGLGEMGIGNTTAASALASVWTGRPPEKVVGRGTGVGQETWERKVAVVQRALEVNAPRAEDPLGVLAAVGGLEIAGLAGVALGAASRRVGAVVDGFISSVAGLAAARLCPRLGGYLLASHRSVEPGHRHVLEALGLRPLLELDMRLGEGTGAALALGLVETAVRVVQDMATFAQAGVADSGR